MVLGVDEPLFVDVNLNTFKSRRDELVVGIKGGVCQYFLKRGGCNHCALPSLVGGEVDLDSVEIQMNSFFERATNLPGKFRTISMYNGGSAFNPLEIPREALFGFFKRAFFEKRSGGLSYLERVSIESRESFVSSEVLRESVRALGGLKLEVAMGLESYDERIRNGDREDVLSSVSYLHEICSSKKVGTFIHLNPMYAAKGSVLDGVWKESKGGGFSLPGFGDVVGALKRIDSEVARIGKDGFNIYLGLSSEGLGELNFSKEELLRLSSFNRYQNLEGLLC